MVVTKAVLRLMESCSLYTEPITGNILSLIVLNVCLTKDGLVFDLFPEILVDPADSSAVIRQKMIDATISKAAEQGHTLTNEDIILAVYVTGLATPASETRADSFTAAGNGLLIDTSLRPVSVFTVTVEGVGVAATSWDVRLEGSLDGTNFTQILQHTQVTGDKQSVYSGSNRNPCLFFRSRCAGLVLGAASAIKVTVLGVP